MNDKSQRGSWNDARGGKSGAVNNNIFPYECSCMCHRPEYGVEVDHDEIYCCVICSICRTKVSIDHKDDHFAICDAPLCHGPGCLCDDE